MRIRYTNATLWRGLNSIPELGDFDVADGVMAPVDTSAACDSQVDLKAAFVMPAFRDGHCHPLFAGREHLGPDVTEASTLAEIQAIIAAYAADNPKQIWIDGAAYDRSIEARFVRDELDAAESERPVVLHGADHHTLWVNTKALELCGLMDEIPHLNAGSVDVDHDGVPTGILREWEAMQLVMSRIPPLSMAEELNALDWAQNELLRAGVVEVQDAWIDKGMAEIYLASLAQNRLKLRTNLAFRADPARWQQDFEYFKTTRELIQKQRDSRLQANAVKFFVDGVLGSCTASVIEPYEAGPGAHGHGEQVWSASELLKAASAATELGFQLHMHAIGDAAVRTALDIVQAVQPKIPAVIAHTELISTADLKRFSDLNVTANMQPLWAREDGQLMSCVPQVGRNRIDTMYRMRDLAAANARISFGSDWPVSSPVATLGIATAVNRSLPAGKSWTIEQSLTVGEALAAYTTSVVSQLGDEFRDGSLFEGQPAEFIVLNENPFELSGQKLFDLTVVSVHFAS